ncbi:alpha/beta hydrolase (plasmid) [Haladaptatus sp. SPP-AMP-3]|uniref:alpha/beta fold hydrolase n=1 Tax=Haladaptatus sp. SPP-AMP-3 TaxID=3121295 RepID=UPI003C2D6FE3
MSGSAPNRDRESNAEIGNERTVGVHGGRTVRYAEYGDPAGVPAIFFHGTPGSRVLGAVFDGHARRHGVRLLAPDRPGYGRSSPNPSRGSTDVVADVTAVLDRAEVEHTAVVGFSGGARYALSLAATESSRVTDVHLVSGATPPSLRERTPGVQKLLGTLARTTPRLLTALFRGQRWVAKRASPDFVLAQYTTDGAAPIPRDVAEIVRRDFIEAFETTRSGAVTECRRFAEAWDVRFEEIDDGVRLWHGRRDTNAPVDSVRRLSERLPDGELTIFENQDHLGALVRSRDSILRTVAENG